MQQNTNLTYEHLQWKNFSFWKKWKEIKKKAKNRTQPKTKIEHEIH